MLNINTSGSPIPHKQDKGLVGLDSKGDTHIHIHVQPQSEQVSKTDDIEKKLISLTAVTEKLAQTLSLLTNKEPIPQSWSAPKLQKKKRVSSSSKHPNSYYDQAGETPRSENGQAYPTLEDKVQNVLRNYEMGEIKSKNSFRKSEILPKKRGRPPKQTKLQIHVDEAKTNDLKEFRVKERERLNRNKKSDRSSEFKSGELSKEGTKLTKRKYVRKKIQFAEQRDSSSDLASNDQISKSVQEKEKKARRPKKPVAFNKFLSHKIPSVMKEYNLKRPHEAVKVLGPVWSAMSDRQKKPFYDMVLSDRLDYQQDLVSFLDKQKQKTSQNHVEYNLKVSHTKDSEQSIQSKIDGILGKRAKNQNEKPEPASKKSKAQKTRSMTQVPEINDEMYNALTQDSSVTEMFDQNIISPKKERLQCKDSNTDENYEVKDEMKQSRNETERKSGTETKMVIKGNDQASYATLFAS